MGLRRFLAAAGLDSRRKCDEYIAAGRVTVDGEVILEPSFAVDPPRQKICVDGERQKLEPKRYFLLNKPKGYLCTNRDPRGRPRAVDLVPAPGLRLFTVGRLDENSEGLLLVTNDGDLANRLAHPRYRVVRRYRVQVAGVPTQETLRELRRGLYFKEGRLQARNARRLKTQGKSAFLEIEMDEGRNREIRRLLARVGHKVLHLQRIAFGPIKLGRLALGRSRPLRPPELKALRDLMTAGDENRTRTRKPSGGRATKAADSARGKGGAKSGAASKVPGAKKTPGSKKKSASKKGGSKKPAGARHTGGKKGSQRSPADGKPATRKKSTGAKAGRSGASVSRKQRTRKK